MVDQNAGGYDIAKGFETVIASNQDLAEAVRSLTAQFSGGAAVAANKTAGMTPGGGGSPQQPSAPPAGQVTTASLAGKTGTFERARSAIVDGPVGNTVRGLLAGPPAGQSVSHGGSVGTVGAGGQVAPNGSSGGSPNPVVNALRGGGGGTNQFSAPGGGAGGIADKIGSVIPFYPMVRKGLDLWNSQLNDDNYYRNIEGGSRPEAWGERTMEAQYQTQGVGVFSGEEASQAFKASTRMGYGARGEKRGATNTRQDVLDYAYDAKKSRGQDLSESFSQIQTASKSLTISLKSVSTAMEAVSETAGKAGVNTEMARAQMTQNMGLTIQGGLGAGAVGVAQAVTQTSVGYGKAYASTVDDTQQFSSSMEYRAASKAGVSLHTLKQWGRTDPVKYTEAMDQNAQGAISTMPPALINGIKKAVAAATASGQTLDENTITQIAQDVMNDPAIQYDDNAVVKVLRSLAGRDFSSNIEEGIVWLVQYLSGHTNTDTAKKNLAATGDTDLQGKSKKTGEKNVGVKSFQDFDKATQRDNGHFGFDQSLAAQEWKKKAQSSGTINPVVEKLLMSDQLQGADADNTHVSVQTNWGERVLTLAEAVTRFPNEIAAGKIKFLDGKAAGKTVASLTGMATDPTRDIKEEKKQTLEGTSNVDKKNWDATHDSADQGGNVKVQFTGMAEKFFQQVMNNPSIVAGQVAGTPPLGSPGNPEPTYT